MSLTNPVLTHRLAELRTMLDGIAGLCSDGQADQAVEALGLAGHFVGDDAQASFAAAENLGRRFEALAAAVGRELPAVLAAFNGERLARVAGEPMIPTAGLKIKILRDLFGDPNRTAAIVLARDMPADHPLANLLPPGDLFQTASGDAAYVLGKCLPVNRGAWLNAGQYPYDAYTRQSVLQSTRSLARPQQERAERDRVEREQYEREEAQRRLNSAASREAGLRARIAELERKIEAAGTVA